MSAWRHKALEQLPEYRSVIEGAKNPMELWIDLHLKFVEVYQTEIPVADLIGRFYAYARWCVESPGEGGHLSDAGTAAICAFYEHLPQHRIIRRDLPRWLTKEEFNNLRETFRYHLSEEEFAGFESEFLGDGKAFRRKPKR